MMNLFQIKTRYLDKDKLSTNIKDLEPNANYVVCVVALSDETIDYEDDLKLDYNITTNSSDNVTSYLNQDKITALLSRSPSNDCISFNTYRKQITIELKTKEKYKLSAFLNRRLGLMVGCSLGCVVFFIMVTILLYTKIKERKRIAKSDPTWAEMNDYHSMISKEDILHSSTNASTDNILLGMIKNRQASLEHFK